MAVDTNKMQNTANDYKNVEYTVKPSVPAAYGVQDSTYGVADATGQ